jgi:hypothetical protein
MCFHCVVCFFTSPPRNHLQHLALFQPSPPHKWWPSSEGLILLPESWSRIRLLFEPGQRQPVVLLLICCWTLTQTRTAEEQAVSLVLYIISIMLLSVEAARIYFASSWPSRAVEQNRNWSLRQGQSIISRALETCEIFKVVLSENATH